jgi:hypothetical protein
MRAQVVVGAPETWISTLPESLKHEFSIEELEQMRQQVAMSDGGKHIASVMVDLLTRVVSTGASSKTSTRAGTVASRRPSWCSS